jgi:type IV secretion system protein VirB5
LEKIMSIRKYLLSVVAALSMMFAALPARAGIPVIDGASLVEQIQQVVSWVNQADQMLQQLQQLQQQYQQLQAMTTKLDGIRSLGTILNDPTISSVLPADMRDSTQLLLNPAAVLTNQANLNQILSSFGVSSSVQSAGTAMADTLGKTQQILSSTQARSTQLAALANRVNTTADAKDSLDMINRNVLEATNVNNQIVQTMASLEAARQSAALKKLADDQTYFAGIKAGGTQPLLTLAY